MPAALEGAAVRLMFKPYKDAVPEHMADRLAQVRDNYSNMTEEQVNSQPAEHLQPLLCGHYRPAARGPAERPRPEVLARMNPERIAPPFTQPKVPAGVPAWAYLQVKDCGLLQAHLIDFYIDNRQAWDGEFGGGLWDDSDFTNLFPSLALMGAEPDKVKQSLSRELEAMYRAEMWTNGLATAQYDELHSYEDGINVLGPVDDDGLRQPEGH